MKTVNNLKLLKQSSSCFNNFENIGFSEIINCVLKDIIYTYITGCKNNKFIFYKMVHDKIYYDLIMPMLC